MANVAEILNTKRNTAHVSIDSSATVLQALQKMADADIGAVLITENNRVIGIFTERDYTRKGEIAGNVAANTPVQDLMVREMFTVKRSTTVDQCLALMKQNRIRHLPVVEDDKLVGIVSMRDVMFASIANRESEIRGLESFLTGSGFQS